MLEKILKKFIFFHIPKDVYERKPTNFIIVYFKYSYKNFFAIVIFQKGLFYKLEKLF